MKEVECSQDFSHYKSMGIFPDAQGQLTPHSLVRSGRNLNSSEMVWSFSLPARMKKTRSKMKALEWSQHFVTIDPLVAEIFKFENVHRHTDRHTDRRRLDWYTISSP